MLQHRCFPVNIAKILRTPFFGKHLRTAAPVLRVSRYFFFMVAALVLPRYILWILYSLAIICSILVFLQYCYVLQFSKNYYHSFTQAFGITFINIQRKTTNSPSFSKTCLEVNIRCFIRKLFFEALSEAVFWIFSMRKIFLKVLWNIQVNTCKWSFIFRKVGGPGFSLFPEWFNSFWSASKFGT